MGRCLLVLFAVVVCSIYSCQKCQDCSKVSLDCGYCNVNGVSTAVVCDSTLKTDYERAQDTCTLKSGSWVKTSENLISNRKVCATESKINAEVAKYEAEGYNCN